MKKQGLYDPCFEHDACGVGFVADINGVPGHAIVADGIRVLVNLTHRGATGGDDNTGDGVGILVQLPHEFFANIAKELVFRLPVPGQYAVGMIFMPRDQYGCGLYQDLIETTVAARGNKVLGWREVPVDSRGIGSAARRTQPKIMQVFIAAGDAATGPSLIVRAIAGGIAAAEGIDRFLK